MCMQTAPTLEINHLAKQLQLRMISFALFFPHILWFSPQVQSTAVTFDLGGLGGWIYNVFVSDSFEEKF